MPQTHVVQQGEFLAKIARQYGFLDYHIVWDDPANESLRNLRPSPNVLAPGDELIIPDRVKKWQNASTGKVHVFRVKMPTVRLRIVLRDYDDRALANADCALDVAGTIYKGKTGADGLVEIVIPATADRGTLRVPALELDLAILVGHLDPVDLQSGSNARLINLGYYAGSIEAEEEIVLAAALEEFQLEHNLSETGKPDKPTQTKLQETHGC